jgi:hypothetical protein
VKFPCSVLADELAEERLRRRVDLEVAAHVVDRLGRVVAGPVASAPSREPVDLQDVAPVQREFPRFARAFCNVGVTTTGSCTMFLQFIKENVAITTPTR